MKVDRPGDLALTKRSSSRLDQPKRLQVTKTLITSPLNQSNHIILDREEPTRQSIGTP